jgi:hypothetical protein
MLAWRWCGRSEADGPGPEERFAGAIGKSAPQTRFGRQVRAERRMGVHGYGGIERSRSVDGHRRRLRQDSLGERTTFADTSDDRRYIGCAAPLALDLLADRVDIVNGIMTLLV